MTSEQFFEKYGQALDVETLILADKIRATFNRLAIEVAGDMEAPAFFEIMIDSIIADTMNNAPATSYDAGYRMGYNRGYVDGINGFEPYEF